MTNPNFTASISTNELYRDLDTTVCLTDLLDGYDADIAELQDDVNGLGDTYALSGHTHDDYATVDSISALQSAIASKANSSHTHSEYSLSTHNHNDMYYTESEIDSVLSGKANASHTHSDYVSMSAFNALEAEVDDKASASHTHDYAASSHTHENYAAVGHDHDDDYAAISHVHSGYATATALSEVAAAVSGKANASHTHDDRYYTESEIDTKLAAKSDTSHAHAGVYDVAGAAASALTSANAYTDAEIASLLNNSTAAVDSIMELAEAMEDNADAITALEAVAASKASASSLTSHTSNVSNPHNVTLAQLGVTATAAELNKMDGVTATTAELNYVDGVTSNIQTQLNNKAASSHTHSAATSSAAGLMSAADKSKLDGIASGANAYTLPAAGSSLGGVKSGGDVTISSGTITVNDDSHNHVISNVDGLQSALDGKAATSHNHDTAYISKDLQMTADNGDISISWSGKNVVTEFTNLASGMYTAYSPAGNTNNPNSSESFRFMVHKTGSASYGWIMAYGAQGSVYTGYIDNGNWKGWKAIFEANPQPLWTGASYMTEVHTITPSKTLSQCRNGWLLLWSDYDPGDGANNTDFYASAIFKRAYTGQAWNGGEWYCDVPSYSAGTATDSEQRVIKLLKIYDTKIVGTANNSAAPRNDVCLRAIYEF